MNQRLGPSKNPNKIELEHPDQGQFQPRNFSRREEQHLPEHREMIPRHFNMHMQREMNPNLRGKQHQMGVDDMRRFREGLNESDNSEMQKEYFEARDPGYGDSQNGRGGKGNQKNEVFSGKLINLSKKGDKGVPYELDPNLSDKQRFNIILNNKQKKINYDLEMFSGDLGRRKDQEKIWSEHESLISDILLEEEELLEFHKRNLDMNIKDFEFENQLLNEVDAPGSDIDKYIGSLKELLRNKIHAVLELNDMLFKFENNLKKEKLLNERIHEIMKETDSGNNFGSGVPGMGTNSPRNMPAPSNGQYPQPQWNNYIQEETPNNGYHNRPRDAISEESEFKNPDQHRLQEESPSKGLPPNAYNQDVKRHLKVNFGDSGGDHMIPGYPGVQREEMDNQGGSSPRLRALPEGIYRHYGEESQRDERGNAWGGYRREY